MMVTSLMPALGASAATLWVAALVATPRRPLPGNEVAELVYARLLGRHQRVALLALLVTATGFVAALIGMAGIAQTARALPPREQMCDAGSKPGHPICYTPQPEGTWVAEELGEDGTWRRIDVSMSPPALREKDRTSP